MAITVSPIWLRPFPYTLGFLMLFACAIWIAFLEQSVLGNRHELEKSRPLRGYLHVFALLASWGTSVFVCCANAIQSKLKYARARQWVSRIGKFFLSHCIFFFSFLVPGEFWPRSSMSSIATMIVGTRMESVQVFHQWREYLCLHHWTIHRIVPHYSL